MNKIAVLGKRSDIMGFTALGLSVYPVNDGEEAQHNFRRLARSEQYAIIYVTEDFVPHLENEIKKYKDKIAPAVIIIPGGGECQGLGLMALKQAVERAVGIDILAK